MQRFFLLYLKKLIFEPQYLMDIFEIKELNLKSIQVKTASPPEPPSNVGVVALTCQALKVGWDPPREHGSEIIGGFTLSLF